MTDTDLRSPSRSATRTKTVPVGRVVRDFGNVRLRLTAKDRAREEEKTASLAASIEREGLLQPPLVRPHPEKAGSYQLVFGSRRLSAILRLGWEEVEVRVREDLADDRVARGVQLVENAEREGLSPIEEAQAIRRRVFEDRRTRKQVAAELSMDPTEVGRRLKLLELATPVKAMLHAGEISPAHGAVLHKHLLGEAHEAAQESFARRAVEENLSFRAMERYIREHLEADTDEDLVEERFAPPALAPTPTPLLAFRDGVLPDGPVAGAAPEQRNLFFRLALTAALMSFNDHRRRTDELGLPVPRDAAAVGEIWAFAEALETEDVERELVYLVRRFFGSGPDCGHRTPLIPPALYEPYMREEASSPPPGLEKGLAG